MRTITLNDEQWQKILTFLESCSNIYIGREERCRRFLEAVFWISHSGARWRLLPSDYGNWNSVYKRFARWSDQGVVERLFEHCSSDCDLQHLTIGSIVVCNQVSATGASEERTTG